MPYIRHASLFCFFLSVLLFFSPGCGPAEQTSQSSAAPSVVVIEGGTLIDGTGAPAVSGTRILIEDGRIQQIGQPGELSIPVGATASHMATVSVSAYAWRRMVANHFSRGAAPLVL